MILFAQMKFTLKRLFIFFGLILLVALALNYKLVGYGLAQAKGQMKVLWHAKPIAEVMADRQFPDSLKAKLMLVQEIKQFAIDSLGLKENDNYTTVYDQQGKEILWVVTACAPYAFEPLMHSFPLIGSFTYKGFFDHQKSVDLAKSLKKQGYDVEMRSVSGWSTLGWFSDPILSNMLADEPGDLASTIIHELTHGTIFIPDSMTFNENLATFIGNKGALNFLQEKYGATSEEYLNYEIRKEDAQLFTRYIVHAGKQLDSLYQSIINQNDAIKEKQKLLFIDKIIAGMDSLNFKNKQRFGGYFNNYRPNNAYFISFLNYREKQQDFEIMLQDSSDNKISSFIAYWKLNFEK